jgi:hypothetical protein
MEQILKISHFIMMELCKCEQNVVAPKLRPPKRNFAFKVPQQLQRTGR